MVAPALRIVPSPLRPVAAREVPFSLAQVKARYDYTLVQRFQGGDEDAFVEIVARHRAKIFQVALGLLHNHADAEEIAQDTFIRAHRNLATFRGDCSLATWLYRIGLNLSRNRYWYYFRRQRHASLPLDAPFSDSNPASCADLVASDAPSPRHEATTNEFAAIVVDCMDQLSAPQREILTLRNIQQYSYDHISRTLGIRVGTAKSRIARARACLRLLLGESYPEALTEASHSTCFESHRTTGPVRIASA